MENLTISSVTGVDLELPIAGPGGRSYAFVIDWHIRFLLALAWWLIVSLALAGAGRLGATSGSPFSFSYFSVLPAVAIYLLYHPFLEWWMDGRTPGKRMAGIRIVTRAGEPPGAGAILIRNAFRVVDSLPFIYCVGFLTTLLTRDHVRIGDLAAGTVLVYQGDTSRRQRERLAQMALQSARSPEFVELVQDVLDRWDQLQPQTSNRLALTLLGRSGASAEQLAGKDLKQELTRLLERQ